MKMAAHPAIASGKACLRRRSGRRGGGRDAGAGARRGREDRRSITRCCRRSPIPPRRRARARRRSTRSRRTTRSTSGISATPRRSMPRSRPPSTSPSSTSSTTAWCRTPWSRAPRSANTMPARESFTLWNTSQNPHVARLVISAFIGMAPEHKLRVIAPDVGGGFGSKIFIYPEEVVCLWAAKKVGRPVKWVCGPLRGLPRRCAWPRPRHPCGAGARRRRQDRRPAGQDHRQSRRLHVDLLVVGADLSLCDAAVGPVRHPADLLRGRRGLHQHRAGRRLSRRRAAGGDLRGRAPGRGRRARARASTRRSCGARTSSASSRTRRR